MNPDPSSALAIPYASAAPAAGITCRQAGAISSRRPACVTIAAIRQPGDDPAEHAVADLLEQQRDGAAAAGDLGFDVGDRDRGEQQRHADAVVEAALDVEALADPLRHARLGHDRLPERGVGRRQHDREDHRLLDGQLAEAPRQPRPRPSSDRQRQPDAEQAHGHADGAPQRAEVDPRGVREQHERERRLGQRAHRRAAGSTGRPRRAPRARRAARSRRTASPG